MSWMFATCLQATQAAPADSCWPRRSIDGFAWWKKRLGGFVDTLDLMAME